MQNLAKIGAGLSLEKKMDVLLLAYTSPNHPLFVRWGIKPNLTKEQLDQGLRMLREQDMARPVAMEVR